ncbi:MAG: outer membrane beta-barrel protein [Thermoanaerobaculia bacterium]
MFRITRRIAAVGFVAGVLPLTPISGQEKDERWTLTAAGAWLSPVGDEVTVSQGPPLAQQRETQEVSEDATGFALGLEYRWKPRIGVELGLLLVEMDTTFRLELAGMAFADTESMDLESVLLGLNWHLTPERRVDVSIGGFVAQTKPDDVIFLTEIGGRAKRVFDDDIGFGVKVGLDVPLRPQSAWGLTASVRYLDTILESEMPGQDLDLDPVAVTAGVRYGL